MLWDFDFSELQTLKKKPEKISFLFRFENFCFSLELGFVKMINVIELLLF